MTRAIRALIRDHGPTRWVPVDDGTIHNYFPDGAISSDELIDTNNDQDYATKLWYGQQGTETLTREVAYDPFFGADAVKIACPGNSLSEGVIGFDWPGLTDEVPAGRYRIGFDLATGVMPLVLYPSLRHSGSNVHSLAQTQMYIHPSLLPQRMVLEVYTPTATRIGINVATTNKITIAGSNPNPTAINIWIGRLIITEGDPFAFADGDSSGWAWSGTANASASSGPQP